MSQEMFYSTTNQNYRYGNMKNWLIFIVKITNLGISFPGNTLRFKLEQQLF